jgi:hypothetical protein
VPVLKITKLETSNPAKNFEIRVNTDENVLLVLPSSTAVYRLLPWFPAFYYPRIYYQHAAGLSSPITDVYIAFCKRSEQLHLRDLQMVLDKL